MLFRKDINGLRAIAVIAVVLFHFNEHWMPGGFAGVDVFFVISGFLMTGIIFKGIEQNSFSPLKFYIDRANRIIPALAFLCFTLLVFGWFYLTPIDYKTLGKHAAGSIGFISNIMYLTEAGYFDSASHEKWLLHTWSLSVEWQFYIIYPLAIIALRKIYTENSVKKLLIFFTGTGFALCVFATYKWPSAAYYLLPTRAWEMMIGGLAYLYPLNPQEKNKKAIEWLGITSIVASYVFINKNTPWPGYLSILPALGSYLIIQANRENSIITGNLAFQKIGLWSYSIYLWHWPLVVAILYFHLSNNYSYLGLALSLLLGFMSYKYIEKNKVIKKTTTIKGFLKAKQTQITLAILATAIVTFTNNGFTNRFNYINNIETLASNRDSSEKYYRQNLMKAFSNNGESFKDSFLCTLDGGRQKTNTAIECLKNKLGESGYLIIGDSHGRDALHALKISYPHINFAMLHQSSCVPTSYSNTSKCFDILDDVRSEFILYNPHIKGIIFASLYGDDKGINSFINDIDNKVYGNIPLFIINTGPRLEKTVVDIAIENSSVNDSYLLGKKNNKAIEINSKLSKIKNVTIFDKYSVFCIENYCKLIDGQQPYLWDGGHLSWLGIEKFSESISKNKFLN